MSRQASWETESSMSRVHKIYFYARVALKIPFLNETPGELRNRIFNATSV